MTPEQLTEDVHTVLNIILPIRSDREPTRVLAEAGKIILSRHRRNHQDSDTVAHYGGAIVWAMRQWDMSWREIYDATGIIQRTGARWMDLFEVEGIAGLHKHVARTDRS